MAKIHSRVVFPVELAEVGGVLYDLAYNAFLRGNERSYENEILTLNGLSPNAAPTYEQMQAVISNGGYFEGIKLGIRFTSVASAQRIVPEEVRGSRYTDEEGVEQERTWIDWLKVNHGVRVITDGTAYVTKAVFNGQLLNSDELVPAHAQAGINVLEWDEVVALYQDENWTEYEL